MRTIPLLSLFIGKLPLFGVIFMLSVMFTNGRTQDLQLLPPDPPGIPGGPVDPGEWEGTTPPMVVDPLTDEPLPARESNRQDLIFGSGNLQRIFLPIAQRNALSGMSTSQVSAIEMAGLLDNGTAMCPGAPPWISRHLMTAGLLEDVLEDYWDNHGFRPVSISANGSGADLRFSAIWLKDEVESWLIHYDMTSTQYNDLVRDYSHEGFRPVSLDAYGSGAGLRYTAIWIKDPAPFGGRHGIGEEEMNAELETWEAAGYRPIWVTGHEGAAAPHFAALWVFDGLEGTARIGLTRSELAGDRGIGQEMTDAGYRLLQISGYLVDDEDDPERFAVSWVKDPAECGIMRWEAFPNHSSTQYQIKASSQVGIGGSKPIIGSSITLNQSDLGGEFRIAHLPLVHYLGTGGIGELSSINEGEPGQVFQHGDILVLRIANADRVLVRERPWGNIRLRKWDANDPGIGEQCDSGPVTCPEIEGQSFFIDDRQYRMLLQYDENDEVWHELQRNGVSHDRYWPLALDEFGVPGERRYASVWMAGNTERTWRATGHGAGDPSDPLFIFDRAVRQYMEERNVPAGALAVVKDGRLVLARGYTWDAPEAEDISPQRRYRLASVSKSLTAVGIMQLVENGDINLNQRIVNIPGMQDILEPDQWADQRIQDVTVRHLLHHIGGWDRDIFRDPMIADFQVCAEVTDSLPTNQQAIIDYMKTKPFNHDPGTVYAYSNFGYTLLGRIIEVVSGLPYAAYMQQNVFGPAGMQHTQLASNTDVYLDFREVRYYQPANPVVASRLGYSDNHPYREPCNSQHSNLVPDPYGGLNLAPMDAHGGWSSTTIDLARFLVQMDSETLISASSRALMWERPAERTRRVYFQDFGGGGTYTDYTWHARGNSSFSLMNETQDILLVGKGLLTFSTIDIELSQPGQNYTLAFSYYNGSSWVPLLEDDHNIQDGTENFTVSGSEVRITFTPPDGWTPVALSAAGDLQPRYWILIRTSTVPAGPPAVVEKVFPRGEADYGLGWTVGHSQNVPYWLRYEPHAPIFPGELVIGQQSKASGVVDQVLIEPGGLGWLRLTNLEGGPFMFGEILTVPADFKGLALGRELSPNVVASHNGLLWGTVTEFKHRRDGIHWVALFNHNKRGAFYIPSDPVSKIDVDRIINSIPEADWPEHDLFELFP
jgi:CubicO group peptidase (beta-lactamase class C family)